MKTRKIVSFLTAVAIAASAAVFTVSTASAEKVANLQIWTRNGVGTSAGGQGGAAYSQGVWVNYNWNTGSPATGGVIENRCSDKIYLGYMGAALGTGYAKNVNPSLDGAEPLGKNRYRLMPFIDSGSGASVSQTVSQATAHAFSEYVEDMANAKITLDMLKGSSYNATNLAKIQSFRLGLAYMDYDHPVTAYTNSTVYYTDIAWYDITTDVAALKGYSSGSAWKDLKTEVEVKVSDILAADHVRINGATAENCTVTAENANAFVLGIVFKDANATDAAAGHQVYFDNINIGTGGSSGTDDPIVPPEEDPTPTIPARAPYTKLMINTTYETVEGFDEASLYDGVYGYRSYNWGSTLHADRASAATNLSKDGWTAFTLNPTKNALGNLAADSAPEGVSTIEESRYRIIPLLTYGTNSVIQGNAHTFSEKIVDFGADDQYLSFDMIKANGYGNSSSFITKYKVGLAFIDYEAGGIVVSGSIKVYPTDIAWYDITTAVQALNSNNSSVNWSELKKTISVKVSDILDSADHQYLHGEPGDLTADNANAVVFGFEMPDTTKSIGSNKTLAFDDLRIDTPYYDVSGSVAGGVTVKAYDPSQNIAPLVVAAYYNNDILTTITVDKTVTANAGVMREKSYTVASDSPFDRVTYMMLDSLSGLKPLCESLKANKTQ